MTKRKITAPNQVKLIEEISQKIEDFPFVFINDTEMSTGTKIHEGQWVHRTKVFMDSPESSIGDDLYTREITMALLTRLHSKNLEERVVDKYTAILYPAKPKKITLADIKKKYPGVFNK